MARSMVESLLWTTIVISAAVACGADPGNAVLHLLNDGFISGDLQPCSKPDHVRWRSPQFVEPLEFGLDCLKSLQFHGDSSTPMAEGDYSFELVGGDMVSGTLRSLTEQDAELDVPELGKLRLRRSHIRVIERRKEDGAALFLVPPGLAAWKVLPGNSWREEAGQVFTEAPGVLEGNFKLPARSLIDLVISCRRRADFAIVMGVGPDEESARQAFRIEAWDSRLVLLRELPQQADGARLQVFPAEGRLHLQVLLDQEAGRCLVFSDQGKQLADLTLSLVKARVWPGIRLINKRGDLRLEQIRISPWSGARPEELASDHAQLQLLDGSIVQGQLLKLDSAASEFILRNENRQQVVGLDRINRILLPPGAAPQPTLRAECRDGMRLSGELIKVDEEFVWLKSPAARDPVRLPLAGLKSITILRSDAAAFHERVKREVTGADRSAAMLELEGVRLRGRLLDGRDQPPASCLVWQSFGVSSSSPLRAGITGRIQFEWAPRRPDYNLLTMEELLKRRQQKGFVIDTAAAHSSMPVLSSGSMSKEGPHLLYLRVGDAIACRIDRIDDKGVSITTPQCETLVAHDVIQAVEFHQDPPLTITKSKRDRLLTLPRMQRDNPPTHLIRSRDGDYLRGRLVDLNDERLQVEVRLEMKELPLELVSRIIWLHADQPAAVTPPRQTLETATRVQSVRSDGSRLTMLAEQLIGTSLSGRHRVIGPCQGDLANVGQLLLGDAIEESASKLAYQQWRLQQALEPFAQDEASGEGTEGTQSNLVGKPAPDFELSLLDGKKFQLSANRGKIVVLEFWTTWCGVCLKTVPQVARVAESFADRNVHLVAVNLEETPEVITAMLQRNQLQLSVALDRNGAVAAKYGVSALPQVLVIDVEGLVFRHFFGGGSRLGEQLTESLDSLCTRPSTRN